MSRMPKKIYTLKSTKSSSYFEFPSNEINIIRRTLENNTHEVIEDAKLKRVTSWRKSETKFKKSLIFNILSFGIVHLISLFYPNLYIKLYCIPWQAKECDYFLVENIYGNLTLCKKIYKKNKNTNPETQIIKENILQLSETNINLEYNNIIKNVTYSFEYKSCLYEYNERNNEIIPIYINLSKLKNIDIYNYFSDGLSNQNLVKAFLDRYGKNEYKLNLNLIYQYFLKSQIPSLVIPIIIGLIEIAYLKNYTAMIIKIFVAIAIIIIQLVIIKLTIINKYNNEFTLDGKKHHVKVKRKYLLNKENQLYYNLNPDELLPGDIILLKTNEYVPCDCIIFNGECLVSESDLTGSLNIYKKIALKNNSYKFNYKYSNINILYHGMKIIKTFSKTDDGYISALCINTGRRRDCRRGHGKNSVENKRAVPQAHRAPLRRAVPRRHGGASEIRRQVHLRERFFRAATRVCRDVLPERDFSAPHPAPLGGTVPAFSGERGFHRVQSLDDRRREKPVGVARRGGKRPARLVRADSAEPRADNLASERWRREALHDD